MSEQEPVPTETMARETHASACPHPEAVGARWGDPISEELQQDLQNYLDQWKQESDHGERQGPFEKLRLSGADVFWLAEQSGYDYQGSVPNLLLGGADLLRAHLEGANLRKVNLRGANLSEADLNGADLRNANLRDAELIRVNLTGAKLAGANLVGALLSYSRVDSVGILGEVVVDSGVDLSDVFWNDNPEPRAPTDGTRVEQAVAHRDAARSHRRASRVLYDQGLVQPATEYRLRELRMERKALWYERRFGSWLFSWFLNLVSGYGYRLGRIIIAYALIVGVFAAAFLVSDVVSGQATLSVPQALDALQISLNAVHGRVFFAQFHLDTVQSWLATSESVIGIVIEGVFVAMLIQRFFGR